MAALFAMMENMKMKIGLLAWMTALIFPLLLIGCQPADQMPVPPETAVSSGSPDGQPDESASEEASVMTFDLTSSAFVHKGVIPTQYSCKDKDQSPTLSWSGAPAGTKSYALIVDDPDAPSGTWVHWVYYNIPASQTSLMEGLAREKEFKDGSRNGENSWGVLGYDGPCPPSGTHRYFFKMYALDAVLALEPGATKPELLKAMQGHILATAELMGTFKK
jgi:Raf kinase inhibitor-like YbhB/YbcL family protein